MLDLIKQDDDDNDDDYSVNNKIDFYIKDLNKVKYQCLIKNCENSALKNILLKIVKTVLLKPEKLKGSS